MPGISGNEKPVSLVTAFWGTHQHIQILEDPNFNSARTRNL
jgi:hypothetical protein